MRHSTRGMVDPFIVMDVMEAARQAEADGRHIIHMEVGQPSTGAPAAARAKLAAELSEPLGYTELAALSQACDARDAALVSDEIYHGIGADRRAVSALEVTDNAYIVNSFSKYFSMTGWRVGWMVVPEDHVRLVERLAQNMFICAPHAAQRLALHAMDCPEELQANAEVYTANRALMLAGLQAAGVR